MTTTTTARNGHHKSTLTLTAPADELVPFNLEAEEATIGSMLMDSDTIPVVRGMVQPGDFYREKHQWICEALYNLDSKGMAVDTLTVGDALGEVRLHGIGGLGALSEFSLRVPTAVYAEYYAGLVKKSSVKRQAIGSGQRLVQAAYDDTLSQEELVAVAFEEVNKLAGRALIREPKTFQQVAASASARFERRYAKLEPPGLPLPLASLKPTLGAFHAGRLIIVGARPGQGKSAFAVTAMEYVARRGARSLMFSLEMSADDLIDRLVASRTGIDGALIRDGDTTEEEFEQVIAAYDDLSHLPISVEDASGITHEYARATIARQIARYPDLRFVVVDYAQIMAEAERSRNQQRYEQIGQVSRQLKAVANQYGLTILLLAQVGRGVEVRENKRPTLADLRESGDLEADADAVLFLYRDASYYPPENGATPEEIAVYQATTEIIVAKHRQGATGSAEVYFDRTTGRWADFVQEEQEASAPPPPSYSNGWY